MANISDGLVENQNQPDAIKDKINTMGIVDENENSYHNKNKNENENNQGNKPKE